jgi:hypothetical protein
VSPDLRHRLAEFSVRYDRFWTRRRLSYLCLLILAASAWANIANFQQGGDIEDQADANGHLLISLEQQGNATDRKIQLALLSVCKRANDQDEYLATLLKTVGLKTTYKLADCADFALSGVPVPSSIKPQFPTIRRAARPNRTQVGPKIVVGPAGKQGRPGASIVGPRGPKGEAGDSFTLEEARVLVTEAIEDFLRRNPPLQGPQGEKGEPGASITDEQRRVIIAAAVEKYLKDNPPPAGPAGPEGPQGPQGPPGECPICPVVTP